MQTGPNTFAKPDDFTSFVSVNATNTTNVDLILQDPTSKNIIQLGFPRQRRPGA